MNNHIETSRLVTMLTIVTRNCPSLPDYYGIVGTPAIDPKTEIAYFFAIGYRDKATSGGVLKATYSLYAVDVNTLEDVQGFPVLIDGHSADNDPTRFVLPPLVRENF